MVIDTSAVVAYLRDEPEADAIEDLLERTERCWISAFSVLECRTVLWHRFGSDAVSAFEQLLSAAPTAIEAFDGDQSVLAFSAYQRHGKGTGHPAQLDFGDCAAYALAMSRRLPLLFKGEDFRRTDVEPCL
jgi:ribonuclease VapC